MKQSEWDVYSRYYDWENARTFGGRDIEFWARVTAQEPGRALELGCGSGRLLLPLAREGVALVGVDRSLAMLKKAHHRTRRLPRRNRPAIAQGDVRDLPFGDASFGAVLAPYGLLQSLVSDRDLNRALREASRVLVRGGLIGLDLVPDLPVWSEYGPCVKLRGRGPRGARIALVEAVRQDRRRGLTIFDEQFIERRGSRTRRAAFTLTFRTVPMPKLLARIERAGFEVEARFGDYVGGPWHARSEAWLILGRKK